MRIYHNQLAQTLNQSTVACWLVFGDEIWQKNDAIGQIKSHLKQQGFQEIIRFTGDEKFDWQDVIDEVNALSLFAENRLIEVDMTNLNVSDSNQNKIKSLSENIPNDVVLLCHGEKLDGKQSKKAWFKRLSDLGCYLPVYELEGQAIIRWLQSQCRQYGLNLAHEAQQLLIDSYEGNLPALSQEIQKLSLLFGNSTIQVHDIESLLTTQARYSPFQTIDAMISGDLVKCFHMLEQMRQEGNAVGQLIWLLHKELHLLLKMKTELEATNAIAEVLKTNGIWEKKKKGYTKALSSIDKNNIKYSISRLNATEQLSKTVSDFDGFNLLKDVMTTLYFPSVTKQLSLSYNN